MKTQSCFTFLPIARYNIYFKNSTFIKKDNSRIVSSYKKCGQQFKSSKV